MRTVSGLVKLIHPDGEFRKEELAEYLEFAVEMRRRVKEQLKRINPDEFKTAELSYIDKETGDEFVVHCPELRETPASADWGSAVERKPSSAGHRIEVFHGYELLQALHAGGMAEAFRARKIDSGETVFLKRARTVSSDKSALERETRIYEKLMRTRCKHMLQILDFIRNDAYVALVTEFADGGDLDQFVEERGYGVTPAETKTIGLELAAAIKELHDHEIIHRDLKPGNVLNASGCWKLTDFGISKNLARLITQKTFQQHGTLGYAAPEQFQGCAAHPSADIYSLGKVVVFLLTGQTDVDHIPFPIWRDLVLKCTDPDPDKRPGIDPVIQELGNIRV